MTLELSSSFFLIPTSWTWLCLTEQLLYFYQRLLPDIFFQLNSVLPDYYYINDWLHLVPIPHHPLLLLPQFFQEFSSTYSWLLIIGIPPSSLLPPVSYPGHQIIGIPPSPILYSSPLSYSYPHPLTGTPYPPIQYPPPSTNQQLHHVPYFLIAAISETKLHLWHSFKLEAPAVCLFVCGCGLVSAPLLFPPAQLYHPGRDLGGVRGVFSLKGKRAHRGQLLFTLCKECESGVRVKGKGWDSHHSTLLYLHIKWAKWSH